MADHPLKGLASERAQQIWTDIEDESSGIHEGVRDGWIDEVMKGLKQHAAKYQAQVRRVVPAYQQAISERLMRLADEREKNPSIDHSITLLKLLADHGHAYLFPSPRFPGAPRHPGPTLIEQCKDYLEDELLVKLCGNRSALVIREWRLDWLAVMWRGDGVACYFSYAEWTDDEFRAAIEEFAETPTDVTQLMSCWRQAKKQYHED